MVIRTHLAVTLPALVVILANLAPVASADEALDQAFQALQSYDWGGSREALQPIDQAVVKENGDADLEQRLADVLDDQVSRAAKDYVCRKLSLCGSATCVPALATLLPDAELSHMARYALEPMPDAAVDEVFRDALGRLKGKPLVGVIGSIGVRRDPKAVEPLQELLQRHQAGGQVMQAAARALGSVGPPAAAQALEAALDHPPPEGHLDVCEGLFRCAEALIATGHPDKAIEIYDRLRGLDTAHQVRGGALRGAILARGSDGLPLLRRHLRSDDYILFSAAAQVAQEMSVAGVTDVLTAALDDLPADNQIVVIQALGERNDPAALPALFKATRSGPTTVRVAAVKAAVEMQQPSVVPVLVELIGASDADVAKAAQEGLGALPGDAADDAVMAMFRSDDTSRRTTALALIGRRRMTRSIPALLKAARGRDATISASAIRMVGELGDDDELAPLLDLLMDAERSGDLAAAEQAVAAVCTKAEKPQSHANTLVALLGQAQPEQQMALLRVLGAIGGTDALKAVRAAVDNDNSQVRAAAIRVLTNWKTPDAAPLLLALAQSTDSRNERTLFLRGYLGIARRRDLPVGDRLAMCREAAGMIRRADEKKLLLGALSSIEAPGALALIVPHLDVADTREEAAMAATTVAEQLLKSRQSARHAPKLIEPLEKVTQVTTNQNLARRAKGLLQQAKEKAGNR
jgi:HEAT repeat protein